MSVEKASSNGLTKSSPVSYSNGFRLAAAEDRLCVEFVAQYPFGDEQYISNHVTVFETEVAKALLDRLAEALDYYPAKPEGSEAKSKAKPAQKRTAKSKG